jgi:hypothetical protein
MKVFLIVYDRSRRELLYEPRELSRDYAVANAALMEAERTHPDMEVVLLEAASLDALKLTHGRYFGLGKAIASLVDDQR